MECIAQLVECQVVALVVMGSTPIALPWKKSAVKSDVNRVPIARAGKASRNGIFFIGGMSAIDALYLSSC